MFQVLLQLGSDAEGSELRARMQSASLLSDMESFKAANPGAVLGDFVRWYSPRDWIDDGEDAGERVRGCARLQDCYHLPRAKSAFKIMLSLKPYTVAQSQSFWKF